MGAGVSTVAHVPLFIWTTYGEIERNSKGMGTDTWGELERLKENHKCMCQAIRRHQCTENVTIITD